METRMLILDLDGTSVTYPNKPFNSSWDALAEVLTAEKRKKWVEIRETYVNKGEKGYDDWFRQQVLCLEGVPLVEAEKALFPVPYSQGFVDFFEKFNGKFMKGIVSSGLEIVARRVFQDFSFDFFSAEILETRKGVFTGRGKARFNLFHKKKEVERIVRSYGMNLSQVCYVGDGFNDIPVLQSVGLPIAFKPKEEGVASAAKYCISDFRELVEILKNEH